MDAYVFNAALWCEDCALKLREDHFIDTGDSGDYPQGPYANGGGEADCPQHCDGCGKFLENPLTSEGDEYVREAWAEFEATGHGAVVGEWHEFYGYLWE